MHQPDDQPPTTPTLLPSDGLDASGHQSDADLMVRLGLGDNAALTELIDRHWKAVVTYAGVLLDADTAEDVAQETFLRLSTHATQWRPLGSVRAYVLRIARNLALNEKRKQRLRTAVLGRARSSLAGRHSPTPHEMLEESDLREALRRALAAMPERRREVFALVRFGGMSYADAASLLGTSPQTVANQMSAAMADLRNAIQPFQHGST